jgi:hypothetical protein
MGHARPVNLLNLSGARRTPVIQQSEAELLPARSPRTSPSSIQIDMARVVESRLASIHDEIEVMPMRYDVPGKRPKSRSVTASISAR